MVIIDVAALDVVDSFTAHILAGCATVARLRGAELVVVGIQPDVALTMVQFGLTADPARTALDLQDGTDEAAHLPTTRPSRRPTSISAPVAVLPRWLDHQDVSGGPEG